MANYLLKYKGKYRLLPEIDKRTNDIVREADGTIIDNDIFISCLYGNKIFTYGHEPGNAKTVWLIAYIPSIGRGRNIKKSLDEKQITITHYIETDAEVEFRFKAKDIDVVADLLKAKILGSSISPFSVKNLPKSNVEIPLEEIKRYREITKAVQKHDLLFISRITNSFLANVIEKAIKKEDKTFSYEREMKLLFMSRQIKEYIWFKGFWEQYLEYLQKEITKLNKRKGEQS